MPKVRASSGTMGTTNFPISGSRIILRNILTKTMVVETSRPSLPSRNSRNSSSFSANWSGLARTVRLGTYPPSSCRRAVKGRVGAIVVADGNAEARAKFAQFVFVELLLLVGDVLAFADFAQAVAFDGARQDDGGRALVLDGGAVGGVDLARVMPAQAEFAKRLVGNFFDQFQQARITSEEMLANVSAGLDNEFLIFAVNDFAHTTDEQTFGVPFQNGIPIASPDDFDNVPTGAAKDGLEFLDDFAVADEGPDLGVGLRLESAILEIAIKAGLVDGHDGAKPHGDGGEFPEIRHQPGMGIGGKSAAGLQFAAEIFQLAHGEAAFQKCAGVHAGRRVALKIDNVSFELIGVRAEEMIETNFKQSCGRGVGGDVPANVVLDTIGTNHHGQGVPANQALDAPLDFLVAGKQGLEAGRNRVGVGGVCGKGSRHAGQLGALAQALEDIARDFGALVGQDGVEGFFPLAYFDFVCSNRLCGSTVIHNFVLSSCALHVAIPPR